jgi:hypothetical protein
MPWPHLAMQAPSQAMRPGEHREAPAPRQWPRPRRARFERSADALSGLALRRPAHLREPFGAGERTAAVALAWANSSAPVAFSGPAGPRRVAVPHLELSYRRPAEPQVRALDASVPAARPQPPPALDVDKLSDQVLRKIERQLRVERQRTGLL